MDNTSYSSLNNEDLLREVMVKIRLEDRYTRRDYSGSTVG